MGAFAEVEALFGGSLIKTAKELGYSYANILIVTGDESALKRDCPNIYQNILSCGHQRDGRTPFAYAQDLVASWIFEDFLLKRLCDNGLPVMLSGEDRMREILPHHRVSASSDFEIRYQGKCRLMEVMCDYTGYWGRTHKIDLRDSKYQNLCQSGSLFLGVSTKDKRFILIDFGGATDAQYIPQHRPYGGKSAYSLTIRDEDLVGFNIKQLISAITYKMCV